ncbi:MAG: hypothetical protein GXO85_06635 [Chlorobi bacterium]|nr:hypothetical protein [Chlorobiota bacterium]
MFIAKIDNGKTMYLTECWGGVFFWAPSIVHAYTMNIEKELEKIAIIHLPNDISKNDIEIVEGWGFAVNCSYVQEV